MKSNRDFKRTGEALGKTAINSAAVEAQTVDNIVESYTLKCIGADSLSDLDIFRDEFGRNRMWHCTRTPINKNFVQYVKGVKDSTYFMALQKCGYGNLCPLCAWRLAKQRTIEIEQAFDFYKSKGYKFVLMTLTLPHYEHEDLSSNVKALADGWNYAKSHYSLRKFGKVSEWIYYRTLEVRYGKNGWHPHYHFAFAIKEDSTDYFNELENLWNSYLVGLGKKPNKHSFDISLPKSGEDGLRDYLNKVVISKELTSPMTKSGRKSYSQFDLLAAHRDVVFNDGVLPDYWKFRKNPEELFKEFAVAMKGKRTHQASRGFFVNAGLRVKDENEVLEDDEVLKILFSLHPKIYKKVNEQHGVGAIHIAYLREQLTGVIELLNCTDISFTEAENRRFIYNQLE